MKSFILTLQYVWLKKNNGLMHPVYNKVPRVRRVSLEEQAFRGGIGTYIRNDRIRKAGKPTFYHRDWWNSSEKWRNCVVRWKTWKRIA